MTAQYPGHTRHECNECVHLIELLYSYIAECLYIVLIPQHYSYARLHYIL